MSAKQLNLILSNMGVQFKQSKQWMLYNKYQDKDLNSNLSSFILMEYYNLKLENNNNYSSSYYTDSLAIMISDYYKLEKDNSSKIIKESNNKI
jgi:hypothetical protein